MSPKVALTPSADWTEGQYQSWVVQRAKEFGWRVHVTLKRVRKASIVADPDWPDLEMVHPVQKRLMYAELKAEKGRMSDGQRNVLHMLDQAGQEIHIWTPTMWEHVLVVLQPGGGEHNIFPRQFIVP